jgi:hypothetical protein
MIRILFVLTICLAANLLFAQDMSYGRSGKNIYMELTNPAKTPMAEWSKVKSDISVSFASDNIRYPKEQVPVAASKEWKTALAGSCAQY